MRNIIKAIGTFGSLAIIFAIGYFIQLYTNFTQLLVSMGIAGGLILAAFVYIYNWMNEKEEELEEINRAIDMTRDFTRELDERMKTKDF